MGKLHYNHRKIEGSKLAQVIVKDLAKRIPPGSGSKAAFRDPVIDLDASGRDLVDEGAIFDVLLALADSIKFEDPIQGKVVRLEELCLKGCKLNTASLQGLAVVVDYAAIDLRDLDLSDNAISVQTEDEVGIWEEFLTFFKKSCVLRRLDLSGNPLGHRAFEVLTRVYAKEQVLDLTISSEDEEGPPEEPEGSSKDVATIESRLRNSGLYGNYLWGARRTPSHEPSSPVNTGFSTTYTGPLQLYKKTRGLRSIPYLVFCDTGMTDTCALHLSYIVESHYTPDTLLPRVPGAKAGTSAQQLTIYDTESNCRGVIYNLNPSITKAGLRALELAEAVRTDDSEEATEDEPEASTTPTKPDKHARRVSEAKSTPSIVTTGKRRRARTSGGPDDSTELALQRARTRVQINTLEAHGLHSNELWHTSIKMLCLGRNIQPLPQPEPEPEPPAEEPAREPSPPPPPPPPAVRKPIIKTLEVPGYVMGKKPAKKLKPAEPLPMFAERDVNQPMTPYVGMPPPGLGPVPMYQKSWLSHTPPEINVITPTPVSSVASGSTSDLSDPPASDSSDPPGSDSSGPPSPDFADPPHRPAAPKHTKSYRSELPCGFTKQVWCRILGYMMDADRVMSAKQQEKMLGWAMDRATLEREREYLGQTQAGQIWRVLDGAGCLAYEMET